MRTGRGDHRVRCRCPRSAASLTVLPCLHGPAHWPAPGFTVCRPVAGNALRRCCLAVWLARLAQWRATITSVLDWLDEEAVVYIAGGTSQVDLMKEGVSRPSQLVDITRLPLSEVSHDSDGGCRVGATVSNTAVAGNPVIAGRYPGVSEAVHAGASQQIRNMASVAGNLLQRTRCPYFRDPAQACNKRAPGTGCSAVLGFNRVHSVVGAVDNGPEDPATCIAAFPSDLAVALAAHDAVLVIEGVMGRRTLPLTALHRERSDEPDQDWHLGHADLITSVDLPAFSGFSHYLKVRDRASYAYGLVSCAVALELDDAHRIRSAGVALGCVAPKPWRLPAVERQLLGEEVSAELFRDAAAGVLQDATTRSMNGYKPALARSLVERALMETSGLRPLAGPAGSALSASIGGIGGPKSAIVMELNRER